MRQSRFINMFRPQCVLLRIGRPSSEEINTRHYAEEENRKRKSQRDTVVEKSETCVRKNSLCVDSLSQDTFHQDVPMIYICVYLVPRSSVLTLFILTVTTVKIKVLSPLLYDGKIASSSSQYGCASNNRSAKDQALNCIHRGDLS